MLAQAPRLPRSTLVRPATRGLFVMTIRVFLSGTCEQPCETHEWTGTLAGFFASKGLAYTLAEQPKSHVTVNGKPLPMLEWADRHLAAADDVEMRLIQHGGVFSGLGKLL